MSLTRRFKNRNLSIIVTVIMIMAMFPSIAFAASPTDLANHWAKVQVGDWMDKGLVNGYPDGTFKPDNNITRSEFMVMVNGAFGYKEKASVDYKDVNANAWYADAVAKAKAAGYLAGYADGTVKPNNPISRQETAVVIMKVKGLTQNESAAAKFTDAAGISQWSKGAIGATVTAGFMNGYPDGSFKANNPITRAEAVVALSKAMNKPAPTPEIPADDSKVYDQAGTYGPATGSVTVNGNVTIKAKDVILQNTIIEGDLTIDKAVGDGNVTLKKVVVKGNTYINGGGTNSVYLIDTQTGKTYVIKDSGPVRIVASGTSDINQLIAQSSVKVEETDLTGKGFEGIIVDKKVDGKIEINLVNAKVENFQVKSEGVTVNTDNNTTISTLVADAKVDVTGKGTVQHATINASGVTFETKPTTQTVASGVKEPTVNKSSSGGGGGGGSSTVAVSAISVEGVAVVGATLEAVDLEPKGADVEYQWQASADDGATWSDIADATSKTYILSENEVGKLIRVKVTGTGNFTGTKISDPVGPVKTAPEEPKEIEGLTVEARDASQLDLGDLVETNDGVYTINPKVLVDIEDYENGIGEEGKWVGLQLNPTGVTDITELEYQTAKSDGFQPLTADDAAEAGAEGEIVWWIDAGIEDAQWIELRYAGEDNPAIKLEVTFEPYDEPEPQVITDLGVTARDWSTNGDKITVGNVTETEDGFEVTVEATADLETLTGNPGGDPTEAKWFGLQLAPDGVDDITVLEYKTAVQTEFAGLTEADANESGVEGEIVWWINGDEAGSHDIWLKYAGEDNPAIKLSVNFVPYEEPTIEADFISTGNVGIAPDTAGEAAGNIYAEYKLVANEEDISLAASNIGEEGYIKVKVGEDGEWKDLTANTDTTLWFNVEADQGVRYYEVKTNDGDVYTATLNWDKEINTTATWVATGGEGIRPGTEDTYVEYKLMDGENQVSLKAGVAKLFASKTDGKWVSHELNTDETLWLKKDVSGTFTYFIVAEGNVMYKITLEYTAPEGPIEANFEPTGEVGIAPESAGDAAGKIYAEYKLVANEEDISLAASNIGEEGYIKVKVGEGDWQTLTANTDATLWFNVEKATGAYEFEVKTTDGKVYTATLDWAKEINEVEFEATGREGTRPGTEDKYVEYEILVNGERLSLEEGDVKLIAQEVEGEWVELEPNTDDTLWFKKDKATGTYYFFVVTSEGAMYKATLDWTETIAADVDYNAVWNETRGTWYIEVSVPGEKLDADSVESIHAITEAGVDLDEPRELTPDTDTMMWFGVAKADGEVTLKEDGEYAYKVVRQDGSEYIFNFSYVPGSVTGATNLVTSALSAVNTAADRDALKVVIEENAVTLELDLTEYNKLIDDRKPSVSSDLLSNKPKEGYDLAKLQEYFNAIVATRLVTQDSMNKANNATTATELEGYVSMLLERFQAASGVYTFHSGEALTDKVTLLSGLMERYNKLDETGQTAVLEKVLVLRTSKYGGEFARSRYTTDAFKTALEAVEGELGTEQGTNIQMMQFAPIINAEEPLEIEAETEVTTEEATESDEVTTDEAVAEEVNEEEITDETAVETDETQLEGEEEVVVETAGAEDIIEEI